jgi:hypothetical protein
MVISSNACAKAVVPANITERQMRYRLTLAAVAAFVGGNPIAAHAQAPAPFVVIPGAGVPGTGIGNGPGAAGAGTGMGAGRRGAGVGAGTGGLLDGATEGSSTGGIMGSARGLSTGTGGTGNQVNFGANTGGIKN